MPLEKRRNGHVTLIHDTDILQELPEHFFEPAFWVNNNLVTGHAIGRGVTWFMQYQSLSLVWRQYRRGGLIGKILKQRFLNSTRSRAEQEFRLLLQLRQWELPVPAPVAARIRHGLCFYQAEIMTLRIPDAEDLVSYLREKTLHENQWFAIGQMISLFHRHNVFHADLNSHNILLDRSEKFWLIDFDKCGIRTDNASWKRSNLSRLKRSFEKEKSLHAGFHFQEDNWQALIKGYEAARLTRQ